MADKRLKEKVTIDLSDAQCLEIGKQQADKELLYARVEKEIAERASEGRDRLKKLWVDIQELATQQKERKRQEEIAVIEVQDLERCTVRIVRADNERELLRTRPMTLQELSEARQKANAERQHSLPLVAVPVEPANGEQKTVRLGKGRKKKAYAVVAQEDVTDDDREDSIAEDRPNIVAGFLVDDDHDDPTESDEVH